MSRAALPLILIAALTARAHGADPFDALTHPVQPSLIADTDAIVPGKPFRVGVLFKINPHWHTYWAYPGDAGAPTRIRLEAPGVTFGEIDWPIPMLIDLGGYTSLGYEDRVLHIVPAVAGKDLEPGARITINAAVQWQVCKAEVCLDGKTDLTLNLPVRAKANAAHEDLFTAWQAKVPVAPDDPPAKKFIASIDQPTKPDGAPHSGFTIRWRTDAPPPNVRWLPVASVAVAVEDVKLTHRGNVTQVQYSTEVFDSGAVPGGVVGGVLVFDAAPDRRLGVDAPVRVLPADTGAGR